MPLIWRRTICEEEVWWKKDEGPGVKSKSQNRRREIPSPHRGRSLQDTLPLVSARILVSICHWMFTNLVVYDRVGIVLRLFLAVITLYFEHVFSSVFLNPYEMGGDFNHLSSFISVACIWGLRDRNPVPFTDWVCEVYCRHLEYLNVRKGYVNLCLPILRRLL